MSSKSRKPRMNKYNGCYRLIRVIKQHDKRTFGTPGFTLVVFGFVLYRFVVFVFICVNLHYVLSWETYQWLKQPRNQQRRNLYMKWSGNLPVVKTTTQPTATESLHEMV